MKAALTLSLKMSLFRSIRTGSWDHRAKRERQNYIFEVAHAMNMNTADPSQRPWILNIFLFP